MAPLPADQDDVRALLEQCVSAWHEHGPRAAEAILARAPELAEPVRNGLAALARSGLLDDDRAPQLPERIGGYRVLALLGRGGMGAVFHARDDTVGRDVAVKVVHPQLLWYGRARERFEREIHALARLRHRGAVPVFHFGEDAGVPYFVMEYVAGRSLAQVLASLAGRKHASISGADLIGRDDRPAAMTPWWRAIVELALQVADTLHHAHQLGIVHRDVKPSNVLVTPEGEARLVDFGLARIDGDPALTQAPTTIGSEPYLAPEQFAERGGRADARSDVFSLGATLYEALALRPPFGTGGPRTRDRILAGDHVGLRSIDATLPKDLAAVCAVALDPDPNRRYATAGAFADDLRAVLAGNPVAARPLGWFGRLLRIARRNKVTAAALLTALSLAIAAPAIIAWQQYESSQQTRAALERAERNRDHALEAIDRLLARVAQTRLFELPEAEDVRRHLLQDAIEVQEAMLREAPANAQIALDTAVAKRRLGALNQWLGNREAADLCNDEALALLRSLPDVPPIELSCVLAFRAMVAAERADYAKATADLHEAIGALERAHTAAALDRRPALARHAAMRRIDLAIVEGMHDNVAIADRELAHALAELRALPEDRATLLALGNALLHAVLPAVYRDDNPLALSLSEAAIDAFDRFLVLEPANWEVSARRAAALTRLSQIHYQQGNAQKSLANAEAAHRTLSALRAGHPQVQWLAHDLAQCGMALADALFMNHRENDARVALDETIPTLRELTRTNPQNTRLRQLLGMALGLRSQLTTYVREARPLLDEAQLVFETLQREDADSVLACRQLTVVYASQASLQRTTGDLDGEAKWLDEAVAAARRLVEKRLPPATEILAALLLDRADCAARGDDPEHALGLLRELNGLRRLRREQLQQRPGLGPLLDTPPFVELLR